MAKTRVFVIGASGTIGKATVKTLSLVYSQKADITAGVRNPEKANQLSDLKGVTVVKAEMGKKEELKEIFKGIDALFIVTPGVMNRTEMTNETAKAAQEAGVKFLLVVSVPTVEDPDTIFGQQFIEIEETVSSLGVPYAFIRLPFFMANYFSYKSTIKSQSSIFGPVDPNKPYTPVVVDDAALAAAAILVSPEKHAGKAYTIASNRHTFAELAVAFSKAVGRQVKYVRTSYEDTEKSLRSMNVPEWQITGMMQLNKLIDAGSPIANRPTLNDFVEITGKKPTELSTWVMRAAPAFK